MLFRVSRDILACFISDDVDAFEKPLDTVGLDMSIQELRSDGIQILHLSIVILHSVLTKLTRAKTHNGVLPTESFDCSQSHCASLPIMVHISAGSWGMIDTQWENGVE
jgi:hypothetical protein